MVLASTEYKREWKAQNPDKVKQYKEKQPEYNKRRIIDKRCPVCGKHRKFRSDYPLEHDYIRCKNEDCKAKLRVIKTLSVSVKNSHGIKLEAVA